MTEWNVLHTEDAHCHSPCGTGYSCQVIQHFTEDTAASAAISTNSIVSQHFWQQMYTA